LLLLANGIGHVSAAEPTYTVRPGDSLWKIANTNHVTVSDLKNWNGLHSDLIYAGQTLLLQPPHEQTVTYTVKPGDSLLSIAKKYGVLIADIKLQNGLTNDMIRVGQTLIIPKEKGTYTAHTVQAGESLSTIARDYSVWLTDLKIWNKLQSDTVFVGQKLFVAKPTGTSSESSNPPSTATNPTAKTPEAVIYTVQAGDSLYKIAAKYGVTIEQLKTLNQLPSNIIYVGQVLKITDGQLPQPAAPDRLQDGIFPLKQGTYTPFGDTYGESRKYGSNRVHEGTDIFAAKGTPIYSATDGTVIRKGWSELGGWRLTIQTSEGIALYYAHMEKYADSIALGQKVKKGQLIGYVGNSGYGPVDTTGKFDPHLHFGMYDANWNAINPYTYLKYWEWKM
jgi:LysM repeat protein